MVPIVCSRTDGETSSAQIRYHLPMQKVVIASSVLLLAIVGCGKPEENFIGSWKLKPGASELIKDATQKQQLKMVEGSVFEISKEKTFTWKVQFAGMEVPMVGKWVMEGDKLKATIETLQGQPLDSVITMVPDAAQKKNLANLKQPLVFTKGDGKEIKMQSTLPNAPTFVLEKVPTS